MTERRTSALLCTEGTYPFGGGGVSTWCDVLCRHLDEVDFTVLATTAASEATLKYDLPRNVHDVVQVPLWGLEEPTDAMFPGLSARAVFQRKRETTTAVIEERFVPLLRALLRSMSELESPLEAGRTVHGLWRYFQRYDWARSWKSDVTWRTFAEEERRPYEQGRDEFLPYEQPSAFDVTTALRWLYGFLLPLHAPIPRVDIAHTSIASVVGLAAVVAKREYGSALLATDHGVSIRERYIAVSVSPMTPYGKRFLIRLGALASRVVYSHADVVAPVANFNRRWEELYDADPERIETIVNGVDPEVFAPRPKPPSSSDRPTVVAAARVMPLKDVETMIRSAAVARKRIPTVRFVVYGSLGVDPPYTEQCRTLIDELGLEGTFELAGYHSNPAEIYNEGDMSVLSSISEGFPYTILESMACARPVAATDVGGVREALEGFGVIVPPRDPAALGGAVVTLLEDDGLRVELGRRAREEVLARFRTSQAIDAYRRLYGRLVAPEETAPRLDARPARRALTAGRRT